MDKSPKILVVEDNDFVRMQLARFLEEEGFETALSRDGEEAIRAMDDDIGLAVVDLRMQPMDGMEFIRCLKAMDRHVPVIVVTGYDTGGLQREPVMWGVGAILQKPVSRETLVETVTRVLGKRA
ncbi:MAG: response regulator [Alphaproteobacteria bacterium]|nr:response regulator [Alphaproteobacteria bacterium]